MKKKILLLTLVLMTILMGCSGKNEKEEAISVENHYQEDLELMISENSTPVELVFINVSGIDIGMLSIIDPLSKKQLNVAPIENNASLTVSTNWPNDETIMKWALYNKNGELCIDGSSDLTGVKESATIVFSGDGDVTDIDVNVN